MRGARWVRALGADPRRVALLVGAIHADAEGRWKDREAESRGQLRFAPAVIQTVLVVGSVLMSLLAAGLMVAVPERSAALGIIVTVFSGCGVALAAWIHGAGLLLVDDDVPVVGHWPVTARDVGVARLWILFRRTMQVAVAFGVIPCVVLAVFVQPWVVVGGVTFVATILQALLGTAFLAAGLYGLRRLLGPRRAQRVGSIAFLVAFLVFSQGSTLLRDRVPDTMPVWFAEHAPWVALAPPFTFVAWPVLFQIPAPAAATIVLAGLAILFVFLRLVVRLIAPAGVAERREALVSPRNEKSPWIEAWLRPWLPGRRTRLMRLLVLAHVREDRHFLARVLILPVQTLIASAAWLVRNGPTALVADDDGTRIFHFVLITMAILGFATVTGTPTSGLRDTRWVVAAAPAAIGDWAAWQRGLARAVNLGVLLPLVFVLHVVARSAPALVVEDLVLFVAVHEAGVRVGQWVQWLPPFSLPPKSADGRLVAASLLLGFTVLPAMFAWFAFVHAAHAWARPASLLMAVGIVLLAHVRTRGRAMRFV